MKWELPGVEAPGIHISFKHDLHNNKSKTFVP